MTTEELKQAVLERIDYRGFYAPRLKGFRDADKAEAKALCPFHEDHHPSLNVNVRDRSKQGAYHCFACGAAGDVFGFVQQAGEAPSFEEAVRLLATEVGIGVGTGHASGAGQARARRRSVEPARGNAKPRPAFPTAEATIAALTSRRSSGRASWAIRGPSRAPRRTWP